MKRFSLLIPIVLFSAMMLLSVPLATAQSQMGERIISYDSDIVVDKDSSIEVTENIKVFCEGSQIQHGIYREFPTRYKDRQGNRVIVGFKVLEVLRDGRPEPYVIETMNNGKKVKIGNADVLLDTNRVYDYTIKYKTTRQLGFFKDHDELYFNITGNGWNFIIDRVSATITLPEGITKKQVTLDGYTGMQGDKGKDCTAFFDVSIQKVRFFTTRSLMPHEGLTVSVGFPKGFVHEPTSEEKLKYTISDNSAYLVGILAILVVFVFYLSMWARVGKDPRRGTIIPLFEPPESLSPSAIRYIHRMGYDNKVFASAVINMAVKGFLTISEKKKVYTLKKKDSYKETDKTKLTEEEWIIAQKLFTGFDDFELKNENHSVMSSTIEEVTKILKEKYKNRYFLTNTVYFVLGLIISILSFGAMALILGLQLGADAAVSFTMGGLFSAVGFMVFLLLTVRNLGAVTSKSGGCSEFIMGIIFLLMFCGFGIGMLFFQLNAFYGLIVVILAGLNVLFYYLLKAPTIEGRKILDKIDGFRMYMATAEKDRLNLLNPPDQTPELFERYLPYALALDVEQQWSQQFESVLEAAGRDPSSEYSPGWYNGSSFHSMGAGALASSIGHSMSNAISSSSTAPGSSSGGGGGGFSGGGGGGGGGGGW